MENLQPILRFKEFKGSWKKNNFGKYVLESAFGPRFSSNLYGSRGNVATLRTTDMDLEGNVNYVTMPLANLEFNQVKDHILEPDDVIISRSGTIGITGVFKSYCLPVVPGAFLIRFRLDMDNLNSEFVKQHFNSFIGRNRLNSLSAGGVQKNLTGTSVKQMEIIFPEIQEQKKIASFLTTVDEKMNLFKKQQAHLELYKKGVMQNIFSRELRFKDENGKDFPEWKEVSLDSVVAINKGKQLNKELLDESGMYPCLNGGIGPSGYTTEFNTVENTIAISEGGNSCGYVNYVREKFWCGGHCYALAVSSESTFDLYLYQFLKFKQSEIMALRVGSGLPNIQKRDLMKFEVMLPELQEQQKIASFLTVIDEKIDHCKEQIRLTAEWKKGLLQQMFV